MLPMALGRLCRTRRNWSGSTVPTRTPRLSKPCCGACLPLRPSAGRGERSCSRLCAGWHAGTSGAMLTGSIRLLTSEGVEATRQFVREAKAFAPSISDSNLFQALRNVWVTHSVQLLLRAPITLSPSVFAYSMLYPWTDNCLDDPQLSPEAKRAFGNWLTLRLAGLDGVAPDAHCGEVGALVARIEGQYPRPEFPDVYFSLQAIHKAQMHSLRQQDASRDWGEQALLDLSIAKGGASVLADASLVRGWLSHEEAEFMFAYGVVLQLIDDLQDLGDDLRNRHMTLFTRQTALGALDALTTRFWAFTRLVLGSFNRFASAQSASLKRLLQDNLRFIVLQSVARHRRFYTPAFVSMLEDRPPCASAISHGRRRPWRTGMPRCWNPFGVDADWNQRSTCWTDGKRET